MKRGEEIVFIICLLYNVHNHELVTIPHSFDLIGGIVDIVLLHHRVKVSNFMLLPTRRRNVVIFKI